MGHPPSPRLWRDKRSTLHFQLCPSIDEQAEGGFVEPFVHVQYGADGVLCRVPFSVDIDGKRGIFDLGGPSSVFVGLSAVARRAALAGEDRRSPCEGRRLQDVAVYSFRHIDAD